MNVSGSITSTELAIPLRELSSGDTARVGGKNASLGEMISRLAERGVRVPDGFATTANAYRSFIEHNELESTIREALESLKKDHSNLRHVGESIRKAILKGEIPEALRVAIERAYGRLGEQTGAEDPPVAVRSSATAEDLPEASFAGQQETYLNIRGGEAVVEAVRKCFASLFTDRAISYREEKGFDHMAVALSAGVQRMVRAESGCSGVLFTIDTESGFDRVVVINSAWGLGETVVGGEVNPDEFVVFKPFLDREKLVPILARTRGSKRVKAVYDDAGEVENVETAGEEQAALTLSDDEVLTLARWGVEIERHYGRAMDVEWAKDGETGELAIVQARPETVQSQKGAGALKNYRLKEQGERLVQGLAIGDAIASGAVRVLHSPGEGERLQKGEILVTEATDPDWGPIMERAAAIVTERGGRTAHAAIVSRELGVPAIVGAEGATEALEDGTEATVSCAEGSDGFVYGGLLEFEVQEIELESAPETKTRIMMNIASPAGAFRWWRLPCHGIGLARIEFIIGNHIRAHPMALAKFDELEDNDARARIEELTLGYTDKAEFFVDRLAEGVAKIAASQHPDPVIVRLSDFKTNEYAGLIGGAAFEPEEANPMLGFRGASRYYSERYRDGFALECRAMRRVRDEIGLTNAVLMIPFCRTLEEADRVLETLAEEGLVRGEKGLKIYVMAEIPSNIILAKEFAKRFDGFSIGSNDLTQLTLGVDRDSSLLAHVFDERNEAVTRSIESLIKAAHEERTPVGICGQAPSDHPEFAEFLVRSGIDTISLNPDSVLGVLERVAQVERELGRD